MGRAPGPLGRWSLFFNTVSGKKLEEIFNLETQKKIVQWQTNSQPNEKIRNTSSTPATIRHKRAKPSSTLSDTAITSCSLCEMKITDSPSATALRRVAKGESRADLGRRAEERADERADEGREDEGERPDIGAYAGRVRPIERT